MTAVAVERAIGEEDAVLLAQVRQAETSLLELTAELHSARESPLETSAPFSDAASEHWPRPLRRLAWWLKLNLSGRARQMVGDAVGQQRGRAGRDDAERPRAARLLR